MPRRVIIKEQQNPFEIAQHQLDQAAELMGLDKATQEMLRWPLRELHVTLPVRMDDGTVRVFHGFRVQYNDARGPNKGGIICDPKELSTGELERLSRAYVRQVGRILGLEKDVPAPDVYTTPQIMAWMMDEYSMMQGFNEFGVITGKPLALGGSAGRDDATARGGMYCVREAAWLLGINTQSAICAIQGYGNAGTFAHKLSNELLGLKTVAVSDSKGGIFNAAGLSYAEVKAWKDKTGSVVDFPGSEPISNADLLELEVDVLLPSALEGVITSANAERVKARILAELANGPTTPDADLVLYENHVYVIPDFLCNAGGVTVSYFEMVQNASDLYWDADEVYERLDKKMTSAFHTVHTTAKQYKVHNRLGAYIVAVGRVVEAMRLRGWV